MDYLHIEDFYKDAARILVLLYKRFPTKSPLYIEDICGPDTPDEFGLHSPRHIACFNTALWLTEENYFRYSNHVQQEVLEDTVLSQNAFVFLSTAVFNTHSTEEVGSNLHTRISELEECIRHRSSEKLSALMLSYLTRFSCKNGCGDA